MMIPLDLSATNGIIWVSICAAIPHTCTMSTISFTAECLAEMSYREMQQLCKQNSLKASGKGADLKARLEDFLREERMLEDVVGAGKDALSDVSNNADSPSNAEKNTMRSAHQPVVCVSGLEAEPEQSDLVAVDEEQTPSPRSLEVTSLPPTRTRTTWWVSILACRVPFFPPV